MLLYPRELTSEEHSKIIKRISFLARYPEKLELKKDSSPKDIQLVEKRKRFLENCSIRQYSLPNMPKGKIILSKEAYARLCSYARNSNNHEKEMTEFGGYLYGTEISPNEIYFIENNVTQVVRGQKVIETPEKLCKEIQRVIDESDCDCIAHIHTHPYVDGHYSLFPSNQDLYAYAHIQEHFNTSDKEAYFLGGLITPINSSKDNVRINDICFIFYDKNVKLFYKCSNIFYEDENGVSHSLPKMDVIRKDNHGKVLVKEKRTILQNPNNL